MPHFRPILRRLIYAQLALSVIILALLPFAGRALHAEDPLEKADAIVVLAGERVNRWLEAYKLHREGWAPIILLSGGYREHLEQRLLDQGIRMPSEGEVAQSALLQLGVPATSLEIVGHADNTAAEGVLLRRVAIERRWTRVIVVTSKLHTRRAGFAMRRELEGTSVRVIMRASRFDDDDPVRYWTRRRTLRTMLSEWPKLGAYLLGLEE